MTFPTIKKELMNYINADVFINHLNIPLYEQPEYSETLEHDNFIKNLQIISDKMDILMKIPHREFWCHLMFDISVLNSLQSYCNNAKRPYEVSLKENSWHQLENEVHKKYYLLILRIMSNKEVNTSEFSNHNFGTLIYDNFVVDIPFLFDICSLYGEGNPENISKIIAFIFSCQSLYLDDFRQYAIQTLQLLEDKINSLISNDLIDAKERGNLHLIKKFQFPEQKSNELLYYIIDLCYSWNVMLNVVKSNTEIFKILFHISFHKSLEKLFQIYVPVMQSNIDKFETSDPEKLKKLLSVSCFYLINIWRKIFTGQFLGKLNEKSSLASARLPEENYELISECISVISSCQDYPIFADAMYLMFPIHNDFEVILQAVKCDKDEYYAEFINRSMKEIIRDIDSRQTMFSSKSLIENQLVSLSLDRDSETEMAATECIDMNICQIKEIFPALSEKEIKAYLQCYKCDAENLLDALLANAITIDFVKNTAITNKNKPGSAAENSNYQSVLKNHSNIYDGDNLDTGKVTVSQLHIGKRQTELTQIDPHLRKMILNIVETQEEEAQNEQLSFNGNLTYDDEFDDVYGISHDGVVIDDKNEKESNYESDKSNKAYRMSNNVNTIKHECSVTSIENLSDRNKTVEQLDNIMEPSNIKFSSYDKNQYKKKKYQDGPAKVPNGVNTGSSHHRLGSHAPKGNTFIKKHHSKADKNKNYE